MHLVGHQFERFKGRQRSTLDFGLTLQFLGEVLFWFFIKFLYLLVVGLKQRKGTIRHSFRVLVTIFSPQQKVDVFIKADLLSRELFLVFEVNLVQKLFERNAFPPNFGQKLLSMGPSLR